MPNLRGIKMRMRKDSMAVTRGELPFGLEQFSDKNGNLPTGLQKKKDADGSLTDGLEDAGKPVKATGKALKGRKS